MRSVGWRIDSARNRTYICRNDVTGFDSHKVTRYDILGGDSHTLAITNDEGCRRGELPQRVHSLLCTVLLEEPDTARASSIAVRRSRPTDSRRIDDDNCSDDCTLDEIINAKAESHGSDQNNSQRICYKDVSSAIAPIRRQKNIPSWPMKTFQADTPPSPLSTFSP